MKKSTTGKLSEANQKLLDTAKNLFAIMVREEDRDKRREMKIEIDYLCTIGKFDYAYFVYKPMVMALMGKV